jgi:glucose-6-phosphate isomerase
MSRQNLTEEPAWKALKELHFNSQAKLNMRNLFETEQADRFEKYKRTYQTPDGEILFDFSKNLVNDQVMNGLFQLVSYF